MADLLELIETIRSEEATRERIFAGDGVQIRGRHTDPRYMERLAEALDIYERALNGNRRDVLNFQEALTTSDFPSLFADVLDRQLLGAYREYPVSYDRYVRVSDVPDFRQVKRFSLDGSEGPLTVVPEATEYPMGAVDDNVDTFSVSKYGKRLDIDWEATVNDDLGALRTFPQRLARGARRTEQRTVTGLWIDASGPHAALYTVGFANKVTGNPPLSIAALQLAWTILLAQKDVDGEPIFVDAVTLVVPPALEIVANNIVNALQIWLVEAGGTANQKLEAKNWMSNRVTVEVDPYIPIVASTANGNTTWGLFANPSDGRAAIELGFLRGNREPALFQKASDSRRIGGGEDVVDFDRDVTAYKVRHVMGGTRLLNTGGFRMTVASNGSGA